MFVPKEVRNDSRRAFYASPLEPVDETAIQMAESLAYEFTERIVKIDEMLRGLMFHSDY